MSRVAPPCHDRPPPCVQCGENIEQGEVRIGKEEIIESDHFHGVGTAWHHKDCFFIRSTSESWKVTSYTHLTGYQTLRPETLQELAVLTGESVAAKTAATPPPPSKGPSAVLSLLMSPFALLFRAFLDPRRPEESCC